MQGHKSVCVVAIAAAAVCCAADGARAQNVFDFTYTSTTNNSYNNRAHMRNTGIYVSAGQRLDITGWGVIQFGGPYFVLTNYDMGLVSPLTQAEIMRNYQGLGNNYVGAPIPLSGESVLFPQDRAFLEDRHDLNISVVAQSAGYVYIGLFDNYFGDNSGAHYLRVTLVPEPAAALALAVVMLCFRRPARRGARR